MSSIEKAAPTETSGAMSETKHPTTIRIKHSDMPEIKDAAPGDEIHFSGKGHVHSNRAADKFGDGEAEVDLHHIEHTGPVKDGSKKKNAAHMPIDELKEVIKSQTSKE